MKKLVLARSYLATKTVGILTHEEFKLSTLERCWHHNRVDVSCIPEGAYIVKRDKTGRHQWYSVQDVEGRTFIELHGGVYAHHSNGCILIGGFSDDHGNLTDSDVGLNLLLEYVGDEDFLLTIRAANKDDFQS
jgi:hypothetical protein